MVQGVNADVAVIGAGAIGGLLAAELHAAGRRVVLCARRPVERLVVDRDTDARDAVVAPVGGTGRLTVATDPAATAPLPWVVVALKAQDSAAAGPWLAALAGPDTVVVVAQNGIEHRARLGPHARGAALLPALANTAVERTAPGRLRHRGGDRIVVPAGPHGEAFAGLLRGGALRVERDEDFRSAAWRKLLSNVCGNPITALTGRRLAVFRDESIRELALGVLREAAAVGLAEGARLAPDEPERTLAALLAMPCDGGSSMLYDRLAGSPLESDALTGAVVRAADRHGVPVPLNRALLALLRGVDGGPADDAPSPAAGKRPTP